MKVKFYLARPAAKQQTAIFATASYDGHRLKIYTGERIDPKFWNAKSHSARSTPRFTEAPEFNRRLEFISSAINKVYLKYKNDHGSIPEPETLAKLVNNILGRSEEAKESKLTLLQYFKAFADRQANGLRINPKSGKPIKADTAKTYRHTLNVLITYNAAAEKRVDFKTVDLEFYNDFTKHLTESKVSLNTIGAHFKKLKTVLAEAAAHGYEVNTAYKSAYFAVQSEAADNIALTGDELQAIEELDLSGNNRLDAVRDFFLIGCHTGLRYSDYSILTAEAISNGFIKIVQSKTSAPVVIPVHPVVQQIFDKHQGKLPASISNQKTNSYLKEICQLVPALSSKSSKKTTKGGVKVAVTLHRWEMVSSHTARRTFATLQYLAGVPTLTIMAITGHKTESAFLKYIKVTSDEHAQKMKTLWVEGARLKLKAI